MTLLDILLIAVLYGLGIWGGVEVGKTKERHRLEKKYGHPL
jgi:hypothetical protein